MNEKWKTELFFQRFVDIQHILPNKTRNIEQLCLFVVVVSVQMMCVSLPCVCNSHTEVVGSITLSSHGQSLCFSANVFCHLPDSCKSMDDLNNDLELALQSFVLLAFSLSWSWDSLSCIIFILPILSNARSQQVRRLRLGLLRITQKHLRSPFGAITVPRQLFTVLQL